MPTESRTLSTPLLPTPRTVVNAALVAGNDLETSNHTVASAEAHCLSLHSCTGFTFAANKSDPATPSKTCEWRFSCLPIQTPKTMRPPPPYPPSMPTAVTPIIPTAVPRMRSATVFTTVFTTVFATVPTAIHTCTPRHATPRARPHIPRPVRLFGIHYGRRGRGKVECRYNRADGRHWDGGDRVRKALAHVVVRVPVLITALPSAPVRCRTFSLAVRSMAPPPRHNQTSSRPGRPTSIQSGGPTSVPSRPSASPTPLVCADVLTVPHWGPRSRQP